MLRGGKVLRQRIAPQGDPRFVQGLAGCCDRLGDVQIGRLRLIIGIGGNDDLLQAFANA